MKRKLVLAIFAMFFAAACSDSSSSNPTFAGYSLSSDSVIFGDVSTDAPKRMDVTLRNSGTLPLVGLTISPLSGEFSRTINCTGTLNAGKSCEILITFAPTTTGSKTVTIDIDSTNAGKKSVPISANAMAATIAPVVDFGVMSAGFSKTETATLTNTSSKPLTELMIGEFPAEFTKGSTTCGTTLDVGASCTVEITYAPTTAGDKMVTLAVKSANAETQFIYLVSTWTTFEKVFQYKGFSIGLTPDGTAYSWG